MSANKLDAQKNRHSLLPASIDDIIAVMEYGAGKYGDNNWRTGMDYSRCFNAAMRHLWAYWRGETNDPESGLPHLAHAATNCLFVLDWTRRGVGRDDRPLTTNPPPL